MQQKSTNLYFKDAKSDKVYKVSLEQDGDLYIVNFAYGKRGGNLKEGTKTAKPVDYDKALSIYEKLVKSKTDKGYAAESAPTEESIETANNDEVEDLTNFKTLKKLLKPFEQKLNLPKGVKLNDVKPTYDSESKYTKDYQRVFQLGLDVEFNEVFGREYTDDDLFLDIQYIGAEPFDEWHWLEDCKEDISFLNDYLYYLYKFDTGDALFQISQGSDKGKLAFIEHGSTSYIDKVVSQVNKDASADEIIEACDFIELVDSDLEEYFIYRIECIKSKGKFTEKKIKQLLKKSKKLDLSDERLTEFPSAIFNFPEITAIDISTNEIRVIPEEISRLKNLRELNLSNNSIASLAPIAALNKLKSLDVSQNFLEAIPAFIFDLDQLTELNLSDSCIVSDNPVAIPENIKNLKKLKSFQLAGKRYEITGFPEVKHIKGKPIDMNPVHVAKEALKGGDKNVIPFIFSSGDRQLVKAVLDEYYNPTTKEMNLSRNRWPFLPEELIDYDIKILNLESCRLGRYRYFDDSDQKELDLKKQSDLKVTNIINKLTGLEELILCRNELHEVPNLSSLKNLKKLDIRKNKLQQFALPSLPRLEDLNVSENNISEIQDLNTLENLKRLDLSNNEIEKIDTIKQVDLEYLNIGSNKFTTMPDFSELVNLKTLVVTGNEFKDFSIASLLQLEELQCRDNYFNSFPTVIFNFPNLKHLDISYSFDRSNYKPKVEEFKKLSTLEHFSSLTQTLYKSGSKKYNELVSILPNCEIK